MATAFIIAEALAVCGLLYAEYRRNQRLRWVFKPAASLLFLLTGLAGNPDSGYGWVLVLGLGLCLLGDVFLIPDSPRWFMAGLGAFLAGHVAYVFAFNGLLLFTHLSFPVILLFGVVSSGFFAWLRPYLGEMRYPVLAYVLVITVMVWSAWAVALETTSDFRWLVAAGATCFYFSDMAVALDRFVKPRFNNAYWGLPLYYLAQFLLALTV